jgi:hypothetical protein
MRKSDSIAKLAPALVAAQAEVENATKNANNPHFRSQYADLAEIIRTVKPVFTSHGLAIMQIPGLEDGHATVETMLVHESGEWITGMAGAPLAKADPQGVGSAITYLRRYSLAGFAGIAQEDDDGNAASQGTAPSAKTAKAPAKGNGGVSATEKQVGLITTLSASSVLTDEERDGVRGRLARGMTIGKASEAIDWLNTTIKQRESEETPA